MRILGQRKMPETAKADAFKGANVIAALDRFGVGKVAIVARRHVLAVEAGEGVEAALSRAASVRQWGNGFWSRRVGVAVVAAGRDLSREVVAQVADAGLAGIAVVLRKFAASVSADVVAEAERRRLFVVGLE